MIGSKFSRHIFNQTEVEPKSIVARACTFSRALCRLRVIALSFDWFTGLPPSFLTAQSNYFGFGFTTLNWEPLYQMIRPNGTIGVAFWISNLRMHLQISEFLDMRGKSLVESKRVYCVLPCLNKPSHYSIRVTFSKFQIFYEKKWEEEEEKLLDLWKCRYERPSVGVQGGPVLN